MPSDKTRSSACFIIWHLAFLDTCFPLRGVQNVKEVEAKIRWFEIMGNYGSVHVYVKQEIYQAMLWFCVAISQKINVNKK